MAKGPVSFHAEIPDNLAELIREDLEEALDAAREDTLFAAKENAPVAFASSQAPFGWPRSFQAATKKPKGAVQGGTLRRSITSRLVPNRLEAEFSAQTDYAGYVHDGTVSFVGRPYITRPIKEIGVEVLEEELRARLKKDRV